MSRLLFKIDPAQNFCSKLALLTVYSKFIELKQSDLVDAITYKQSIGKLTLSRFLAEYNSDDIDTVTLTTLQ